MEAPTLESHPFRIGLMVYRTLDEAKAAKVRARKQYPDAPLPIIDRRLRQQGADVEATVG